MQFEVKLYKSFFHLEIMRVLILGGSSSIGSSLAGKFSDVCYTYHSNPMPLGTARGFALDLRGKDATLRLIEKLAPSIVINAVGAKGMDICETNRQLAYDLHVKGTMHAIEGCKKAGATLVLISTSAVFSGGKKRYTEEDEPDPINYYGTTKALAEAALMGADMPSLIVRTDHPYGWLYHKRQKTNTAARVLDTLNHNETVEEITDWYNNPTYLENLADVVARLLEKEMTGIVHAVGSDFLNRYEFALAVASVFEKDATLVRGKPSSSLNLIATRSSANLDNTTAQRVSGMRLLGVRDGLTAMKGQAAVHKE